MLKKVLACALTAGLILGLGACQSSGRGISSVAEAESEYPDANISIGFSQVGEESDWRRANSASIRSTFTSENGYHLLFEDAQSSEEKQVVSVRNFIQQGVDYIILEPILETGWDDVLMEAKDEGIPVIVADRKISVEDDSLYTAWIGSDFYLEGKKACEWLRSYTDGRAIDPSSLNIVRIEGTQGSTAQIERERSLVEYADKYDWNLLGAENGDFTQAKGREAMTKLLTEHPDLNVVYCDNDNEAYGAIEAIKNAGRLIGSSITDGEIMIISFDAARQGLTYVRDGLIAYDGECNPLHGPRLEEVIRALENGKTVEKTQYVEESAFAHDAAVSEITVDGTTYPVKVVTNDLLQNRVY